MTMTRRTFSLSMLGTPALRAAAIPSVKITRIALATIEGRFHRFVAMNSYDQSPKGHTYTNTVVRIFTDQGVEGVGVMDYSTPDQEFLQALKTLIGGNPLEFYEMSGERIVGRSPRYAPVLSKYLHLDGPLFDLIGKLTGKPCWRLIGDAVRERVEVYDGTLYFSDIWFGDRGVRAVVEEAEEAWRIGYKGMKFKLGRGAKWMDKEAGLLRDVEVINAVRKALGADAKILTDANNGYRNDYDRASRLLKKTQEANLYWVEEIFPEDQRAYTRLREDMAQAGIRTLIADGEGVRRAEDFTPYLKPSRLIDVLQMDIRRGGFLENLKMARLGEQAGALSVPHNWGSQVGGLMGLHLSKAVKTVSAAEDDRSTCDVIHSEGYEFHSGLYTVSNAPGLGIKVNEQAYSTKYKAHEMLIE